MSSAITFITVCNEDPSAGDLKINIIKHCKCYSDFDLDPTMTNIELIQDIFIYYNMFFYFISSP